MGMNGAIAPPAHCQLLLPPSFHSSEDGGSFFALQLSKKPPPKRRLNLDIFLSYDWEKIGELLGAKAMCLMYAKDR
jgi:hypothetical protein